MTRSSLFALFISPLIACAPAIPDIGGDIQSQPGTAVLTEDEPCYEDQDGDGYYYPVTENCHADVMWDYDDTDPDVTTGSTGNADEASQHMSCTDSASHQWIILDYEGGFHQDYEPSLAVLVDDGSWYMSENGWLELPTEPRAPLGIQVVDLANGHVYPPEVIAQNTMVTLLDDNYVEVAELTPSTATDSVQYNCPDPPE